VVWSPPPRAKIGWVNKKTSCVFWARHPGTVISPYFQGANCFFFFCFVCFVLAPWLCAHILVVLLSFSSSRPPHFFFFRGKKIIYFPAPVFFRSPHWGKTPKNAPPLLNLGTKRASPPIFLGKFFSLPFPCPLTGSPRKKESPPRPPPPPPPESGGSPPPFKQSYIKKKKQTPWKVAARPPPPKLKGCCFFFPVFRTWPLGKRKIFRFCVFFFRLALFPRGEKGGPPAPPQPLPFGFSGVPTPRKFFCLEKRTFLLISAPYFLFSGVFFFFFLGVFFSPTRKFCHPLTFCFFTFFFSFFFHKFSTNF